MKKLVVANWKMNPTSLAKAKELFLDIKSEASRQKKSDVVIAPPIIYLSDLMKLYTGAKILFGVQDVFWQNKGSHTGEISPKQVRDLGASYVIVGHSERRALGETNEDVSKKIDATLRNGMRPILCIGEEERDAEGKYLEFIHNQIKGSLKGVSSARVKNVVIAYEPLWAIGKDAKDAIDSHELHAVIVLIRKSLSRIYNKKTAMKVKILYGGSVEPTNAEGLYESGVDGFLVGHASLNPKQFIEILKSA